MPLAIYILRTYHFPTPINATTQLDARSTAQSYCGMPPLRLRSKVRKLPNNSSSANTPIGRVKVGRESTTVDRFLLLPATQIEAFTPPLPMTGVGCSHPTLALTCIYHITDEQDTCLPDDFDMRKPSKRLN
ncbi:MAG: hypothetical protein LQ348_000358 [Seirophora lacunosa]|nr:MAG: hypothetical protein LQ348_000358 [Seirophora lacunosa]